MRDAQIAVAGEPDEALLRSAAALRRIGARLTRYDVDARTLEARVRRFHFEIVVRLRGDDDGPGRSRLHVESERAGRGPDLGSSRRLIRRFERALATTSLPELTRRA